MKQNDTLSFNVMKYDQFSKEPLMVDEFSFWRYYLEILEVQAGSHLSESELDVLAYVLAGTPGKSYFKKPVSTEIEEKFGLKFNNFHRIKYDLANKGYITPTEIRGDYILNPRLDKYQRFVKEALRKGLSVEYKFKFKLDETKN